MTLTPTFGTMEGFETFRHKVRTEDRLLSMESATMTDWWLMKFFDGARGNVDLACKMLEKTLQWRIDYAYGDLPNEDYTADYETGKLYYHRFALDGTPVLIWRISRHLADPKLSERTVRFIVWTMDKGIREGTITSRITLLVDRSQSTQQNIENLHFFRLLTSILQTHFPEMLQRIVIFPTNWLLWTVWKVVKPFLDVTVVEKVALVGPKEVTKTLETVWSGEDCPERYGGKCVDWTDDGVVGDGVESLKDSAVAVELLTGSSVDGGKKGGEGSSKGWGVGRMKKMLSHGSEKDS
ncbi:hypothetical protein SpCBS45565_g07430 [Spizellomyces sp. 'palustris']|nr:hypothetical protein SpCBS45565_g07430 [Spizellomyces sp. 'palustris']